DNALRHGIAQLLEGGLLRISAIGEPGGVTVEVENPRDPELSGGRGAGVGLENVRGRLRVLHGDLARVDVTVAPQSYRVRLTIPWSGATTTAREIAGGRDRGGS